MKKLTLLCFFILLGAAPGLAQTTTDDYNKFEFYGGFSHNRVDLGGGDREGANGIELAVTGNISRYFGLKADYAFHRKSFDVGVIDLTFTGHTFVAGVQIKDNSKETKVKPFVHAMLGGARLGFDGGGSTGFAGVFGGGIDIRAGKSIDIRIVQFDYNPTRIEGSTQHNFRIGAGIVFH